MVYFSSVIFGQSLHLIILLFKWIVLKNNNPVYSTSDTSKVVLSEEEWKKILPADFFQIARQKGTKRPWSSTFETLKDIGTYYCAACGNALFKIDTKFESNCDWPGFYESISKDNVFTHPITHTV